MKSSDLQSKIIFEEHESKESDVMKEYNINGFPTMILITNNNEKIIYDGNRSIEEITSFVENHAK
jgi:protein-disulfide isomerase-like protein with CxxC motif